ncbi:MAG: roadblock/LC7 domain-containing protein [Candidatus Heimdallarchaeaceae archaeon]
MQRKDEQVSREDLLSVIGFGSAGGRNTELNNLLKELESSVPEIEAAAVVSVEGLPIASALPRDIEETRLAAMTAAMLSLGERVIEEMKKGHIERVFIEGSEGTIISMNAGPNAVLTVSSRKDAKLGLIFLEMGRAARKIADIL